MAVATTAGGARLGHRSSWRTGSLIGVGAHDRENDRVLSKCSCAGRSICVSRACVASPRRATKGVLYILCNLSRLSSLLNWIASMCLRENWVSDEVSCFLPYSGVDERSKKYLICQGGRGCMGTEVKAPRQWLSGNQILIRWFTLEGRQTSCTVRYTSDGRKLACKTKRLQLAVFRRPIKPNWMSKKRQIKKLCETIEMARCAQTNKK